MDVVKHGRFYSFEAININIIDDCVLHFPAIKPQDLEFKKISYYYDAELFNKNNWFLPAFVANKDIGKIVSKFKNNNSELLQVVKQIYNRIRLSSFYIEYYSKLPYIKDYSKTIFESFEAFFLGLNDLAILSLIPVIEGATRKIYNSFGGEKDDINKQLFDSMIEEMTKRYKCSIFFYKIDWVPIEFFDTNVLFHIDEYIQVVVSYKKYIDNCLYQNTSALGNNPILNRHVLVHGLISDINDSIGFYKLVSILDMICFLIIYSGKGNGFSLLGPDLKDERIYLCNEYLENIKEFKNKNNSLRNKILL